MGVRRGSLTLLSLSYLLVATLSRVGNLDKLVSLPWATGHIAAGCLGGLLVAFVGTAVRRRHEPDQVRAARAPMPIRPILASLRSFDERARDGVRRAVPLAILMFFFQLNGGRDAFWAFFAAYLVLLAPGKTPRSLAAARVGSTLFGVLLLAVASLIVPNQVLFSLGLIILFSGVGRSPAYPVIGGGLTTIGSVLLAGAPTGGDRHLVDASAPRHRRRLCDRARRQLPVLAARQRNAGAGPRGEQPARRFTHMNVRSRPISPAGNLRSLLVGRGERKMPSRSPLASSSCPLRARSGGQSGIVMVIRGQTGRPADLRRST